MAVLSEEVVIRMVVRWLKYPSPVVNRYIVAASLLSALEVDGYPLTTELMRAVCFEQDKEALKLLGQD